MRRLDADGIALIKGFESFRGESYDDASGKIVGAGDKVAGTLTIGWGHTRDVKAGDACSPEQAEIFLAADLAPACAAVEKYVRVALNDHEFAALVSFVFNVGVAAFSGSTLLKRLNGGHYDSVPQQLARWNKAGGKISAGLTRRRAAEAALWSAPLGADDCPGVAAAPVDVPRHLGHLLTLGGITVGAVSSTLSDFAQQLQPLAEYGGLVKNIFLGVAMAAAGVAVLARMRSFNKDGV